MRILFVDDEQARHKKVVDNISKVEHAYNVEEAFALIKGEPQFDIISLDHDMGPSNDDTGYSLVKRLCDDEVALEKIKGATILIHSFNRNGALNMSGYLQHFGISAELIEFGRNLIRRVKEIANDRIRLHKKVGE